MTPEELAAMRRQMEEDRQARLALEARLKAAEDAAAARAAAEAERQRQEQAASLTPTARVQHDITHLRGQLDQTNNDLRKERLASYRHRRLAEEGQQIIAGMVGGNTEAEIELSIEAAKKEYKRNQDAIEARVEKEIRAKFGIQAGAVPPQGMQQVPGNPGYVQAYPPPPPGYVPAPPPNPGYAAPQGPPGGGFPTPTNPLPPTETGNQNGVQAQGGAWTGVEELVRSGQYSGDARANALNGVKGMGRPGNLGNQPRFLGQSNQPQVGYVQMPNGVQQPQGRPTGPAAAGGPAAGYRPPAQQPPPQYQQPAAQQYGVGSVANGHQWDGQAWRPLAAQQQPVYQQQVPPPPPPPQGYGQPVQQQQYQQPQYQQQPDPMADFYRQGQEAIQRTHAGQNPMAGQNPGGHDAVRDTVNHQRATGVDPQTAYQQRFQPTPAVQ